MTTFWIFQEWTESDFIQTKQMDLALKAPHQNKTTSTTTCRFLLVRTWSCNTSIHKDAADTILYIMRYREPLWNAVSLLYVYNLTKITLFFAAERWDINVNNSRSLNICLLNVIKHYNTSILTLSEGHTVVVARNLNIKGMWRAAYANMC